MEKFITATGKTIDLAIAAALEELHMDRDSVSVEVLENPRSGFLGIGAQPARVKVTYEAPDEAPKPALSSASRSKPKKPAESKPADGAKVVKIGVFEPASGDNGAGGKQEVLGVEYANSLAPTVEIGGETFTVGVLVLTNHGCLHDLTIGGENIGKAIEQRIREDTPDEGSCIMIVGTDLPVTSRQLGRIIRRCCLSALAVFGPQVFSDTFDLWKERCAVDGIAFQLIEDLLLFAQQDDHGPAVDLAAELSQGIAVCR